MYEYEHRSFDERHLFNLYKEASGPINIRLVQQTLNLCLHLRSYELNREI